MSKMTAKPTRRRNNGDGHRRRTFRPIWRATGFWVEERAVVLGIIPRPGTGRKDLAERLWANALTLRHVIRGAIQIPKGEVVYWADRLKLAGQQRRQFLLMAMLSYVPDQAIEAYLKLDPSMAKDLARLMDRQRKHDKEHGR